MCHAGLSGLQSYNSMPIPRADRVSIDGRCDRRRPLPNLDELVPVGSSSGPRQKWARMRKQLKWVIPVMLDKVVMGFSIDFNCRPETDCTVLWPCSC